MTLTYGQIRRWNSGQLDGVVAALRAQNELLIGLQDELAAAGAPEGWTGRASDNADAAHRKLVNRMEHTVAEVAAVRRAVGDCADAVIGVRHAIDEADGLAAAYGHAINDKGHVVEVAGRPDPPRDLGLVKAELRDRVKQVLRMAKDVDGDLKSVLHKAAQGRISDHNATSLTAAAAAGETQGAASVLAPPRHGSPGANAGWWDALSPRDQEWVIQNRPQWIGNRDGIPAFARDKANRARLKTERTRLEKLRDELRAEPDRNPFDGWGNAAELDEVEAKLRALDAIKGRLTDDHQLLLLDVSHHEPMAAIAVGNVDKAKNVAVLVPGVGTDVSGDDLGGQLGDASRLKDSAEAFKHSTAAITWIGYDPPDNLWRVLVEDTGPAHDGADDLTNFLNGIDTSRDNTSQDGDPHLTVVGHSYGSTTAGYALQGSTGVDDLIVAGSPGLGTNHLGDLKVPDEHVWVVEANRDPVADSHWFGMDPSWFHDANQLRTDDVTSPDGQRLEEVKGHSHYFDRGSTSLYNMGAVVAGEPGKTLQVHH